MSYLNADKAWLIFYIKDDNWQSGPAPAKSLKFSQIRYISRQTVNFPSPKVSCFYVNSTRMVFGTRMYIVHGPSWLLFHLPETSTFTALFRFSADGETAASTLPFFVLLFNLGDNWWHRTSRILLKLFQLNNLGFNVLERELRLEVVIFDVSNQSSQLSYLVA